MIRFSFKSSKHLDYRPSDTLRLLKSDRVGPREKAKYLACPASDIRPGQIVQGLGLVVATTTVPD